MEYLNLWPTTILKGKFDTDGMVDYILTNYDINNLHSETSGYNMFDTDHETLNKFKDMCYGHFDDYLTKTLDKKISDWGSYTMKAWLTGHGKDYNMTIHNHSGAHLSAVYYVLAEQENAGGAIVFSDPRTNANRGFDDKWGVMFEQFKHMPKTGDFMIFPSFTYHHVNPYLSSLRMCIPVDLFLHRG